jgi:uncharacterized protein
VCANEKLSRLDEELDRAYRAALERQSQADAAAELKYRQREWLRARKSEKDAIMLSWDYERQIETLQALPDFPAPDTPVEYSFSLNDVSRRFDFTLRSLSLACDWGCSAGQIVIHEKGKDKILQTIHGRMIVGPPNTARRDIYDAANPFYLDDFIYLDDFNFDGHDDFAVWEDRNGPYSSPTYAVYLFNPKSARFQYNTAFSELTQGYLGFFGVDRTKKRLYTRGKSGCCFHDYTTWAVVNNLPVRVAVRAEEIVFDRENVNYERLKITHKRLVKGKWRRTVRYERLDE